MSEELRPIGDVAHEVGQNVTTLRGWAIRGVRGLDGQRVYLEIKRIGKRWLTSLAAVERFNDRLAARPVATV